MATLTETIAASADHDFMELAIKAAGMEAVFSGPTAYTILGPQDAYFMSMAAAVGYRGTDETTGFSFLAEALRLFAGGNAPKALFQSFVEAHMLTDSRDYATILNGDYFSPVGGGTYSIVTGGGAAEVDDGNPDTATVHFVLDAHTAADNGYLHALDAALTSFFIPDLSAPFVDLRIGGDRRSVIHTGAGNDYIAGRGGNDHLVGGTGADVITGGAGRDKVFGGHGNDRLFGDSSADSIFGGLGSDVICGGAGNDVLRGYKGVDTFVITEGGGRDIMPDFRSGIDKIDVREIGITNFSQVHITFGRGRIFVDLGDEDLVIFGRRGNAPDADDFLFAMT